MRTTFSIGWTILIAISIGAIGLESFFIRKAHARRCNIYQEKIWLPCSVLWLNRTELILQEDSEDDLTEDDSVTFKEYFGESDDELNKSFYGFEEEYEVMEEDSTDDSAFLKYILSLPN